MHRELIMASKISQSSERLGVPGALFHTLATTSKRKSTNRTGSRNSQRVVKNTPAATEKVLRCKEIDKYTALKTSKGSWI